MKKIGLAALAFVVSAGALLAQVPGSPSPSISSGWDFLVSAITIFGVNIVLSGDNGVLIAMTVSALPKDLRFRAVAIGAGLAVIFQVAATFFASRLLHIRYVQLVGGLLIFWISINLFRGDESAKTPEAREHSFWRAILFIVVADLTMSTDNILAVAAIAKGNFPLLMVGLGFSIVVVVCASGFLAFLIGKYPLIVFAGAAILGNVAAEMIMTDPFTVDLLRPGVLLRRCVQAASAAGVVTAGYLLRRRRGDTSAANPVR
jgi:YjbE family integral membrane protein